MLLGGMLSASVSMFSHIQYRIDAAVQVCPSKGGDARNAAALKKPLTLV
jgi:hypothetical protein